MDTSGIYQHGLEYNPEESGSYFDVYTEADLIEFNKSTNIQVNFFNEFLDKPQNFIPLLNKHVIKQSGEFKSPYCEQIAPKWRKTINNGYFAADFNITPIELVYDDNNKSSTFNQPHSFYVYGSKYGAKYKTTGEPSGLMQLDGTTHLLSHLIVGLLDTNKKNPQNPNFLFISDFEVEDAENIKQFFPNLYAFRIREILELSSAYDQIKTP